MVNKRTNMNTKNSSKQVATASMIRQVITSLAEKKVVSVAAATQTISSAGTVINLTNNVVEGDDLFNRNGTKIRYIRQTLKFRFSAVTTNQSARFLLVRDLINTGVTPTVAEILPAGTFQSHFSDTRQIQQKRFVILHDETLDCSINGETVKSAKYITIRKPGVVYYNGATAVASSNGVGAVFLVVIGSSSTGQYDYDWQIVFNDY